MPKFKITDNVTGKTVTITGEQAPTEAQAEQIFKDAGLRNKEQTFVQKAARKVSNAAPVVGGTLGALIGGLAGSPTGPGAIATGAAGAAAGTGAGLAVGESLENLTGIQDETTAQLAKEAIVKPVVAGTVDAATAGAMKAAAPIARGVGKIAKSVGRAFVPKNASVKAFSSIFKVPSSVARSIDVDGTSREIIKHGFHGDLDDMVRMADDVTGETGVVSRITRNVVAKLDEGVPVGKALDTLKQSELEATGLKANEIEKIRNHVLKIVNKRTGKKALSLDPLDALDAIRELEDIGYGYAGKTANTFDGVSQTLLEQKSKFYLDAASELKLSMDDLTIKAGAIDAFKTPKILGELEAISPRLAKQFSDAQSLSELRSIAKPFVNLKNLANMTQATAKSGFMDAIRGNPGIGAKMVSMVERPEVVTSVTQGLRSMGESLPARVAMSTAKTVSPAISNVDSLFRILSQIGTQAAVDEQNNPTNQR